MGHSPRRKVDVLYDLRGDGGADLFVRWDRPENPGDPTCLRIPGRWVYGSGKLTFEMALPDSLPSLARSADVDFPREGTMRMIGSKGSTLGALPDVSDCREMQAK